MTIRALNPALAKTSGAPRAEALQARCFGDVAEVVGAIINLLEEPHAHARVFNIGRNTPISIEGLATRSSRSRGAFSTIPTRRPYAPGVI